MKAFLDANILFSAAQKAEGTARQLWRLAEEAATTLITSELAVQQAAKHLSSKKPAALPDLADLVGRIEVVIEQARPNVAWGLDEEDGVLLATAIDCGATHFVTGDKHFRPLANRADVPIRVVTIRELIRAAQGENSDAG